MPALGRLIIELLLLKTIEEIIYQKDSIYLKLNFDTEYHLHGIE